MSKRARLEKVVKDTGGRVTPPELLNEVKPKPEDASFFDMFFEIYQPDQNFYVVLDAYMRVWDLELDGEDINLLQMLWREAMAYQEKKRKEKEEKNKPKNGKSPKKPRRAGRRR